MNPAALRLDCPYWRRWCGIYKLGTLRNLGFLVLEFLMLVAMQARLDGQNGNLLSPRFPCSARLYSRYVDDGHWDVGPLPAQLLGIGKRFEERVVNLPPSFVADELAGLEVFIPLFTGRRIQGCRPVDLRSRRPQSRIPL